jgi:ribosome-associated translation inhibitor RaiA
MIHNENFEGVKIDIQTIGIEMNRFLQQRIKNMLQKLKEFLPGVNWIDVHLKNSPKQLIHRKELSVRFGIPGPDIIASDAGYSWKAMLKNVEKKLIRQLNKRKAIEIKNRYRN